MINKIDEVDEVNKVNVVGVVIQVREENLVDEVGKIE